MGGHGALLLAAILGDRLIGLAAGAGWLRKETYGDANRAFYWDVGAAHAPAALRAALLAPVAEFEADLLAPPNLAGRGASPPRSHPLNLSCIYINSSYIHAPSEVPRDVKLSCEEWCVGTSVRETLLAGVPTLVYVGARDNTVPPYESRRAARLLAEVGRCSLTPGTPWLTAVDPALAFRR